MSLRVRRIGAPIGSRAKRIARAAWLVFLLSGLAAAQAVLPLDKALRPGAAASPRIAAQAAGYSDVGDLALKELISEALKNNPEIQASLNEKEAARQRVAPAGALEDPMIEAGVLNVPTTSLRLNREDMTMKMLGLSQKLPWPGKRALRREVAAKEAQTAEYGYRETVNRVVRELTLAYFDLSLVSETIRFMRENLQVLDQFLKIAESRYAVGQSTQADVLKAQTQLAKMSDDLLRMERERPAMEAELAKLLGRAGEPQRLGARLPGVRDLSLSFESLLEAAVNRRPQLLGLRTVIDKGNTALELARKDYQPDFDLRLSYGQRESMLDGTPRPDMVSVIVAINLPIWGGQKRDPRIAEAQAMRDQAMSMYRAQENELAAKLRQQMAMVEQSRKSARLYESTILPQAELAVESTLAAYRVNRAELLMLLDSQMNFLNYRINRAGAVVNFNKALAEIDWLTGATEN